MTGVSSKPATEDSTEPSAAPRPKKVKVVLWSGRRRAKKREKRKRRPRSFRFTREGKVFVAVTMGVGLASVNTGNNLLYLVLGLMLSLLLVSGVLSDVVLWRIRIDRRVPTRAFAGQPALIELTLRNLKKRLPSYALEVEDRAEGEVSAERSCFFLKVAPAAQQSATYRRRPKRRGMLRFEELIVRTRYPFGLIEKGRRFAIDGEVLVFPALVPTDAREVFGGFGGETAATAKLGRGAEVAGLREYQEGDGARSIHWRRTAALGRLVVRERLAETRAHLTIVLDDGAPPADHAIAPAWAEGLEAAISEAASLASAALGLGASVEVRTRAGSSPVVLPGAPPDPIWRYLALLEPVGAEGTTAPQGPNTGKVLEIKVSVVSASEVAA